jgi:hypothetical protein
LMLHHHSFLEYIQICTTTTAIVMCAATHSFLDSLVCSYTANGGKCKESKSLLPILDTHAGV